MKQTKIFHILTGMAILTTGIILIGVLLIQAFNRTNEEIAETDLQQLLQQVNVTTVTPRKATVDFTENSLASSLPDITEYPLCVAGTGEVDIEIFASPEKAGTGSDSWLVQTANAFNSARYFTKSHKSMSVSVRCITSGMGADYIVSGKYLPDAYTPSNAMWGIMACADGAKLSTVYGTEKLVGNTAGILLPKDYPYTDLQHILQDSMNHHIAMGYTYPYTSSTGLNFLISALYSFDSENPLSSQAVTQFQKFQASVPFVCYTTQQMRSAMNSGSLNACVMEYQTFYNDAGLQEDYQFVPFGAEHNNPLYEVGNIGAEKQEVLQAFTSYCLMPEQQKQASAYGFNQLETKNRTPDFDAVVLRNAQELWKKEKDSGKPVIAVFVADTSGSMNGTPLSRLKTSLIQASQYISNENYIGLISYNNQVTVNLPVEKFDLNQRSYFTGAVQDLTASGSTCTYDAVLQGVTMLLECRESVPEAKPMLFVLSDGETNTGYHFSEIEEIISNLDIPVYTIGYNANLTELEYLSALNEAACINADTEDVIYQLSALFNAQM